MKKTFLLFSFLFSFYGAFSQYEVSLFAGTGASGFKNGPLLEANFKHPFGICIDQMGNMFLADNENNCIREIKTNGTVSTFAGSATKGFKDGPAASALFAGPTALCFDLDSNLLVCDFENQRIRKISKQGIVTTIAGTGVAGFKDSSDALSAQFNYPRGICVDKLGNIYIGDSWNHRIRKIDINNSVTTFAGGGDTIGVQSKGSFVNGNSSNARFYTPCEIKIDQFQNIYVADAYNHRIRKIDENGNVTTVAGSGESGNTAGGFENGDVGTAKFNTPTTLFVDTNLDIYLGDGANHRVRKISKGMVSTFAGDGNSGMDDGPDSLATFDFPRGVVKNKTGDFFIVDYNNHSIRKIAKTNLNVIPINNQINFSVSPNPFQNKIYINAPKDLNYSIFNVDGKKMSMGQVPIGASTIELSDFPLGIYFLKIVDDDFFYRTKIIVKQ